MAWCWSSYSKGNKKKKKNPIQTARRAFFTILFFCFVSLPFSIFSPLFFLNFVVVAWKSLLKANEKSFWRDLIERMDSMKIKMNSFSEWKTVFFEKYQRFFKVLLIRTRVQFLRVCDRYFKIYFRSFSESFIEKLYLHEFLCKYYISYKLIVSPFHALHEISDFSRSRISLERRNLPSFVLLSIGLRKYSSKLIKIFQLKRYNVVEVFLRGFSKRILRARRFVFLDGDPY